MLDVTDNRRLTLWVAFGLTLLGGIGLDQLGESRRLARGWLVAWVVGAARSGLVACAIPAFEPQLRERAVGPLPPGRRVDAGRRPAIYQARAERQVRQLSTFLPRYHALVAVELGDAGRAGGPCAGSAAMSVVDASPR